MSQENVEIVRKQIEDLRRRDWDAWAEAFDPKVEFRLPAEWPDEEANYFKAIDEMWSEWRSEDIQIFDAGDDRLASPAVSSAKGVGSGVPVDLSGRTSYDARRNRSAARSSPNPPEPSKLWG